MSTFDERKKGFEATVAFPGNWEVWSPFKKDLLNSEFKYKVFKKKVKTKITPFLINDYLSQKLDGPIYISSESEIKINNINYGKEFFLVAVHFLVSWLHCSHFRCDTVDGEDCQR